MRDDPCLLDSTVWIRSIRRSGSEELRNAVEAAVRAGLVATCAVVRAELLVGARDAEEFGAMEYSLSGLVDIPILHQLWDDAAHLGFQLRHRGVPMTLPDLLIAQCAISSGRTLWHADRVFERVKQHAPLQTRAWEIGT